ncbi:MAG: hypothetical protein QOF43_1138 [Gaiellaceae bacterium]|jgi:hypothetical protein|nr:hypothetical protein [Gaiellaceae bacterium]
MRRRRLLVAATVLPLVLVASASALPRTTNAPAILTVKVTITDTSITVRPSQAARGTNASFILTNRGTKTKKWILGDATRGVGKKIGFASTLNPNQQKTIVMFLDYRGLLPYSAAGGGKTLKGRFIIH